MTSNSESYYLDVSKGFIITKDKIKKNNGDIKSNTLEEIFYDKDKENTIYFVNNFDDNISPSIFDNDKIYISRCAAYSRERYIEGISRISEYMKENKKKYFHFRPKTSLYLYLVTNKYNNDCSIIKIDYKQFLMFELNYKYSESILTSSKLNKDCFKEHEFLTTLCNEASKYDYELDNIVVDNTYPSRQWYASKNMPIVLHSYVFHFIYNGNDF